MKNHFYKSVAGKQWLPLLMFLSIWAGTMTGQSSMGQALPENMQLEQSFQMKQIPPAQLQMYQERGEQKVRDFFDLLLVLREEDIEEELREFMIQQGADLFLSDTLPCMGYKGVTAFLQSEYVSQPISDTVHIEDISRFVKESSGFVSRMHVSFPDLQTSDSEFILLDVHLVQRSKSFGKEEMILWEVFLGEMQWE